MAFTLTYLSAIMLALPVLIAMVMAFRRRRAVYVYHQRLDALDGFNARQNFGGPGILNLERAFRRGPTL